MLHRAGVAMWFCSLILTLLLLPAPALAGVKESAAALAPAGLVLVMDTNGSELVAQNADQPFVPASVTKIVTAWLAMEVLGGDYRFETRFYLDDKRVLYVRGGGDPFLISEELAPLATKLVEAVGKKPITGIVLDASYYPSNLRIPGIEDTDQAYNALNAALAVQISAKRGDALALIMCSLGSPPAGLALTWSRCPILMLASASTTSLIPANQRRSPTSFRRETVRWKILNPGGGEHPKMCSSNGIEI
jgi:hypothetical protein